MDELFLVGFCRGYSLYLPTDTTMTSRVLLERDSGKLEEKKMVLFEGEHEKPKWVFIEKI